MPSIAERLKQARAELGKGRPDPGLGDTGIQFRAWYNSASSTLLHAATDDDPRCMRVLCAEANVGALMAIDAAKNDRQTQMAEKLIEGVAVVRQIAETTPPLNIPHQHGEGWLSS